MTSGWTALAVLAGWIGLGALIALVSWRIGVAYKSRR